MNAKRKLKEFLCRLIRGGEIASFLAVALIIAATMAEIALRIFSASVPGVYDAVSLCASVAVAGALPLTTAAKGHVAIEYFFRRMGKTGRLLVDSLMRTLQLLLFAAAAFALFRYGLRLLLTGEVMPTLSIPLFLPVWLLAMSCSVCALVTAWHLCLPGEEVLK